MRMLFGLLCGVNNKLHTYISELITKHNLLYVSSKGRAGARA